MDYEKKYKEALEWARKVMQGKVGFVLDDVLEKFPELKKSEDERILKIIKETLKSYNSGIIFGSLSARDYADCLAWLEKQGEQKPAWSEEDEERLQSCLNILQARGIMEVAETVNTKWLKSLKERVLPQPKQEWSEEDKDILFRTINDLKFLRDTISIDPEYAINIIDIEREITWLNSLRPQNKYAYNPYKAVVESIAEMCKHYDKASHSGLRDFYDNVKVKCKDAKEYDSLYPQNTWKPSDEQMTTLEYYMHTLVCNSYKETLFGLYQDLKKLREE